MLVEDFVPLQRDSLQPIVRPNDTNQLDRCLQVLSERERAFEVHGGSIAVDNNEEIFEGLHGKFLRRILQ